MPTITESIRVLYLDRQVLLSFRARQRVGRDRDQFVSKTVSNPARLQDVAVCLKIDRRHRRLHLLSATILEGNVFLRDLDSSKDWPPHRPAPLVLPPQTIYTKSACVAIASGINYYHRHIEGENFWYTFLSTYADMDGLLPEKDPEEVMMKILLTSTQAFFASPDILPERTMGVMLNAAKRMLERSQNKPEVRYGPPPSLELVSSLATVRLSYDADRVPGKSLVTLQKSGNKSLLSSPSRSQCSRYSLSRRTIRSAQLTTALLLPS